MQAPKKTSALRIGPYELFALEPSYFALDGGAMFGTVPKNLWSRSNPADDQNRIKMQTRILLLKGQNRSILVDVGLGGQFVEKYGEKIGSKFGALYKVESEEGLSKALAEVGLRPSDVTDVILTHLHFDHAGGATSFREGRVVPFFEKATYYVQASHLEIARRPNIRERASFFGVNFEPLMEGGQLQVVGGPQRNLLSNISVTLSSGHTEGMQIVHIHDEKTTLIYCADLIPTASHIRRAWIMGYDLQPIKIIEEKEQLLSEAANQHWILFFEHDPEIQAARIGRDGDDFMLVEKIRISN